MAGALKLVVFAAVCPVGEEVAEISAVPDIDIARLPSTRQYTWLSCEYIHQNERAMQWNMKYIPAEISAFKVSRASTNSLNKASILT